MNKTQNFQLVFESLKNILMPYARTLVLKNDDKDNYHLNTAFIMKNKKPMYFSSVKINKNYVSFHLMPIYVFPELKNNLSTQLKRRMQGKSCFNFTSLEDSLIEELSELTHHGYLIYEKSGYLNA